MFLSLVVPSHFYFRPHSSFPYFDLNRLSFHPLIISWWQVSKIAYIFFFTFCYTKFLKVFKVMYIFSFLRDITNFPDSGVFYRDRNFSRFFWLSIKFLVIYVLHLVVKKKAGANWTLYPDFRCVWKYLVGYPVKIYSTLNISWIFVNSTIYLNPLWIKILVNQKHNHFTGCF